jgi:hypothetical protein
MSKLKAFFGNEHIEVAIATGMSIIVLAYFSKRVLPEPIPYLQLAFPPFLMTLFEAAMASKRSENAWFKKPVLWVAAIIAATIAVIVINAA